MTEYYIVDSCTSANAFEVKFKDKKLNLEIAQSALEKLGETAAKTPVVLLFKIGEYAVSVYASGRILIKNIEKEDAEKLAKKLVNALEKSGAIT